MPRLTGPKLLEGGFARSWASTGLYFLFLLWVAWLLRKPFNALLRDAIEVNITRLKPSGNPVFISLDNPIQQLRAKREIGGAVVKNNGPQSFIFGELNADKRMQIKPRINEHSINMSRFQARYKSAIAGVFLSARDNDRQ